MLFAILLSVSAISVGLNFILLNGNNNPKESFSPVVSKLPEKDSVYTLYQYNLPKPPEDNPKDAPLPEKPVVLTNTKKFTVPVLVAHTEIIDTVAAQSDFGDAEAGAATRTTDSATTASVAGTETGIGGGGESTRGVIDWAEIMPEFPGGVDALLRYIAENTEYPDIAVQNDIEGTVHVQFVVDRDGSLTDVRVLKKSFKCLDDEAMRVVKSMPKWKPGKQNGETVRVRYSVPIRFTIN